MSGPLRSGTRQSQGTPPPLPAPLGRAPRAFHEPQRPQYLRGPRSPQETLAAPGQFPPPRSRPLLRSPPRPPAPPPRP
eukprot:3805204-Pyramimonas_sp.AAC.1